MRVHVFNNFLVFESMSMLELGLEFDSAFVEALYFDLVNVHELVVDPVKILMKRLI